MGLVRASPAKPYVTGQVDSNPVQPLVRDEPDVLRHVPIVDQLGVVTPDLDAEGHAGLEFREIVFGQPGRLVIHRADTVAHKTLPLGTRLTLTNPNTGAEVKVQVTDRGPYVSGRSLDLSYSAARKLGVVERGIAKVWMEGG